jgi:hypothetical protein
MSLPKRYSIRGFSAALVEEDNGVMVKYSDYELLRQEFSLLAEERYTTICSLQAENERLRKAGDALLECHKIRDDLAYSIQEQSPDVAKAMLAWLAAKESQP